MPIEFRCSQCDKLLRTADDTAGKQARCPECGTVLSVPAVAAGPAVGAGWPDAGGGFVPPPPPPGGGAGSPFGAGGPAAGDAENPYQAPMQYGASVGPQHAYVPPSPGSVPNHLVPAILCTLFCCVPFGIVAIVFAAQVNAKLQSGDYAGAMEASSRAQTWCWASFASGLIIIVLYLMLICAGGAFS